MLGSRAKLAIIIQVFLFACLLGCSKESYSNYPVVESELRDSTEKQTLEIPVESVAVDNQYDSGIVMSDVLTDFTVEIDGVVYQVPMSYSELLKAGWTMKESDYYSALDLLDPGRHANATMKKGEKQIDIGFINMSGNTKPLSECTIGEITVSAVYNDDNRKVSVKLAGGIEMYVSTYDNAIAAFGEPDYTSGAEDDLSISYYLTDEGNIFLSFDAKQVLRYLKLKNEVALPNDEMGSNEAIPEFFKNYVAPNQLGDSPVENIVEWRGDLYTLPAPITAFEEYGWTVSEYRIDNLKAKELYGNVLILERNGEKEWLNLYNIANYQTTAQNCVVNQLFGSINNNSNITLSGGITCGSSFEDVEKLVGRDNMTEVDWEYRFKLSSPDNMFTAEIIIDKETDLVHSIEVSCLEWQFS